MYLYVTTELVKREFLKGYMRSLWEQHVAWTRLAIISIVFHLPDVNVTVKRLLQNATHMGLSLEPFYGEDAVKNIVH